ncbi:MAG: sensor histidine kinase [Limisphaerales bacterium]
MLAVTPVFATATDHSSDNRKTNALEIQSVLVDGKSVYSGSAGKANLGPFPKNISFNFGPGSNVNRVPIRLRYKLDGYDSAWRQGGGEMNLTVRFYNEAGDQVSQDIFTVSGDSAGWNGNLKSSQLTHRRETLVVPPQASRLWIVISSAGGPATVGIYVVENLVVSKLSGSNEPEVLLRSPFDSSQKNYADDYQPEGWIHDGTHPSMAKIVEVGQDPATKGFAVLDSDPFSHAEWHNIMAYAPKVAPGDHLVVEWNEMYSIGLGDFGVANYNSLPAGNYRFQVAETTAIGVPTGREALLTVIVPQPFWKEPWFLGVIFLMVVAVTITIVRYILWQRMRMEMAHLKNQRALEQERLRIAHDIHDDLGARVTQISLLSAMAHDNQSFPEKARSDFNHISQMSRDLVSALYETVWAVNPENDNLDALGNYLCQMVNQLCEQAQLGCRLHIQDLPKDVQLSSQIRHNITMSVKESLHNIIKHSKATEVIVRMTFEKRLLTISIQDNGRGFQPDSQFSGHGLKNIKRRLEDIGGSCSIEGRPNEGTIVQLRLFIHTSD